MKISIEIPTWLGDAVMATPAIENILIKYPNAKFTIVGSYVSTKLFLHHPNVEQIIIDESKKSGNRYINLYKLAKQVGSVDIAISFRRNFTTTFLLWFIDAKEKYKYKRYTNDEIHLVRRYNDFVNRSFKQDLSPKKLKIYGYEDSKKEKKVLGINPGATYGSAKRWYPNEFAKVVIELSSKYDTIIFGGPTEIDMANDIEKELQQNGITNYQNLAGKTSVEELLSNIASLDLFITNDSGPMHVAAAFGIPSVCIFGPTKFNETSQWQNDASVIVKKDFSCMPCMKRECPLSGNEYHQCMKNITYQDIVNGVKEIDNDNTL
jgi:heptosyltransferase II